MSKTNKQKCIEQIKKLPCPKHPSFIGFPNGDIFYKVKRLEYGTNLSDCSCGCDGPSWLSTENEYLHKLFFEDKDFGSEFEQAVCVARIYFLEKNDLKSAKAWEEIWEMAKKFRG